METAGDIVAAGLSFVRNVVGLFTKPYETYRRIVDRGTSWELIYIALVGAAYFALASVVKTAAFRPFLLTRQFIILCAGAASSVAITIVLLWIFGRLLGGRGTLGTVARAWAYTLMPTIIWFFATSILYVVLPPPRTESVMGIAFSIVFLIASAMLFWWKVTLAYLALRFSLKLDLPRIITAGGFAGVGVGFYTRYMYQIGVFRVPFL